VDAFQVAGLYLWFNSNDHLPPHFHAEEDSEWEVTVRFLRARDRMIQVEWGKKKIRRGLLKKLCVLAETHRAELLAEWQEKVLTTTPGDEE
jgi:hypothetical protein